MSIDQFKLDKEQAKKRPTIDRVLTIIFIGEQILLMLYIIFKKGNDILEFFFG